MSDKPDEPHDSGSTPPSILPEWKPTRTPTPASGHVQAPAQRYERRARKRRRDQGPLYLPAWSVGLMLLLVFGIVGAIVLLVITLGGQSAPGGQPRIVILTAEPSDTPSALVETTATVEAVAPLPNFQGPLPTFGLAGPTLPPVILSPTPIEITVGATVTVNVDGLNIRQSPGLDQKVVTNANQGDQYVVIGGPQQADNLTWWNVQDISNPDTQGWAAGDYLDVAIPNIGTPEVTAQP